MLTVCTRKALQFAIVSPRSFSRERRKVNKKKMKSLFSESSPSDIFKIPCSALFGIGYVPIVGKTIAPRETRKRFTAIYSIYSTAVTSAPQGPRSPHPSTLKFRSQKKNCKTRKNAVHMRMLRTKATPCCFSRPVLPLFPLQQSRTGAYYYSFG